MRKLTTAAAGAVIGALMLAGAPQEAHAGSEPASSSMAAFCVDVECTTIQFNLLVWADGVTMNRVNLVHWTLPEGANLTFDHATSGAKSQINTSAGWWDVDYMDNFEIHLTSTGQADLPAWFQLDVTRQGEVDAQIELSEIWGTTYGGTAFDTNNTQYSFRGTVVPEPTSMILLGSGLVGLAGVVRRRRRNEATGLETDLEGI